MIHIMFYGMGCLYEGDINPIKIAEVTQQLFEMGCYEVSLGDTIEVDTAEKTKNLMQALSQFDFKKLAVHFHDTYDRAITNILVALEHGIQVVDSSVSGLRGCPYAGKPSENVATETQEQKQVWTNKNSKKLQILFVVCQIDKIYQSIFENLNERKESLIWIECIKKYSIYNNLILRLSLQILYIDLLFGSYY